MNSLSCSSVLRFVTPGRSSRALSAPLFLAFAAISGATLSAAFAVDARADDSGVTAPAAREEAQAHFKKARELYAAGSYREAAVELEAARSLDPRAKDLVFNHGVVMERLGRIDDALADFHQYESMDLTAAERSRAEATIRRLEGAKRETDPNATAVTPVPTATPSATTATTATTASSPETEPTSASTSSGNPPPSSSSGSNGRMDGATIGAGVVGIAGLTVGTIFGVMALGKNPTHFVTGSGQSYSDYTSAESTAKSDATISTVGFGVGIAGAAVAAILYFARSSDSSSASASRPAHAAFAVGKDGAMFGGSF